MKSNCYCYVFSVRQLISCRTMANLDDTQISGAIRRSVLDPIKTQNRHNFHRPRPVRLARVNRHGKSIVDFIYSIAIGCPLPSDTRHEDNNYVVELHDIHDCRWLSHEYYHRTHACCDAYRRRPSFFISFFLCHMSIEWHPNSVPCGCVRGRRVRVSVN